MVAERDTLLPRERPVKAAGITERVETGCGYIYVTVNKDKKGLCEVIATLGKPGSCAPAQLEAIGRLVSLALRSGINHKAIVKQLRDIRCGSIAWDNGIPVLSCADAISQVLGRQGRKRSTTVT